MCRAATIPMRTLVIVVMGVRLARLLNKQIIRSERFASNGFEEDLIDATNVRRIKGHTELLCIQTFIGDRIVFAKWRISRHCTSTVGLASLEPSASLHFADPSSEGQRHVRRFPWLRDLITHGDLHFLNRRC